MSIIPYVFGNVNVRIEIIDNEPWFVAKDICDALELDDTSKAVSRLDNDEKGMKDIPTPGGTQKMTVINESGLYSLILRSNKPQAKHFKKWVTSEVLPSIRKTGNYGFRSQKVLSPMELMELQFQAHKELNQKVEATNDRIDLLESSSAFTASDCFRYQNAVKTKAHKLIIDNNLSEYDKPSIFAGIHGEIKRYYGVASYKDLPHYKLDDVLDRVEHLKLKQRVGA